MPEDTFNLDSLLEDLDQVVQHSNSDTIRFVPHPPKEKPLSQNTLQNPKNRFAVRHSSDFDDNDDGEDCDYQFQKYSLNEANAQKNSKKAGASDSNCCSKDEASIDNLLDMFNVTSSNSTTTVFGAASKGTMSNFDSSDHKLLSESSFSDKTNYNNLSSPRFGSAFNSNSSTAINKGNSNINKDNYGNGCKSYTDNMLNLNNSEFGSNSKNGGSGVVHKSNTDNKLNYLGSKSDITDVNLINAASFNSNNNNNSPRHETSSVSGIKSQPGATSIAGNSSSASSNTKIRCTRVVLGGSAIERGRKASSFAAVACNNLRCLQCNFTVHCFSGYAWDNTVDYMFLRNTVPNEVKLSSKLVSSQQSCAYCCQCSFASESADRQLTQGAKNDPQWICAGH